MKQMARMWIDETDGVLLSTFGVDDVGMIRKRCNAVYRRICKERNRLPKGWFTEGGIMYRAVTLGLINQDDYDKWTRDRRQTLSKLRSTTGRVSRKDRAEVIERDKACLSCGSVESLTIDHIKPVKNGGTGALSNLQLLCRSCNSRKGLRTADLRRSKRS